MSQNRTIYLVHRPKGSPSVHDFELRQETNREIQDGEARTQTLYLSVDPYMRNRMRDAKSYQPPYELNAPVTGAGIGRVLESRRPDLKPGDVVLAPQTWSDYAILSHDAFRKLDPSAGPITASLSVLGMTGRTAYYGLKFIGQPKPGETVVISGAAGTVGMVAGQIAKRMGARVIGIAGSEEKIRYLVDDLGFDAALNYKTSPDLAQALHQVAPEGVDVYFDNVGGQVTDAVVTQLNFFARIILCGQISQYDNEVPDMGPRVFPTMLSKSITAKGFIVSDYAEHDKEALEQLDTWVRAGHLKMRENVVEGLENTPDAFLGLFRGDNIGKQLVKVSD